MLAGMEESVPGKAIWEGRSSPLLFLYEYVGIVAIAYLVKRYFDGHLYLLALLGMGYFYLKARSMKYSMSGSELQFSPSIGDKESLTVKLSEILAIEIVDRQPWSLFRLGTVILITDPDAEYQPCMKCIEDPHALAQRIRRAAQAAGLPGFPVEVTR